MFVCVYIAMAWKVRRSGVEKASKGTVQTHIYIYRLEGVRLMRVGGVDVRRR